MKTLTPQIQLDPSQFNALAEEAKKGRNLLMSFSAIS